MCPLVTHDTTGRLVTTGRAHCLPFFTIGIYIWYCFELRFYILILVCLVQKCQYICLYIYIYKTIYQIYLYIIYVNRFLPNFIESLKTEIYSRRNKLYYLLYIDITYIKSFLQVLRTWEGLFKIWWGDWVNS